MGIHKFLYFLLKFYTIFQLGKKSCGYNEYELNLITMFDFSALCTKVEAFSAITYQRFREYSLYHVIAILVFDFGTFLKKLMTFDQTFL